MKNKIGLKIENNPNMNNFKIVMYLKKVEKIYSKTNIWVP